MQNLYNCFSWTSSRFSWPSHLLDKNPAVIIGKDFKDGALDAVKDMFILPEFCMHQPKLYGALKSSALYYKDSISFEPDSLLTNYSPNERLIALRFATPNVCENKDECCCCGPCRINRESIYQSLRWDSIPKNSGARWEQIFLTEAKDKRRKEPTVILTLKDYNTILAQFRIERCIGRAGSAFATGMSNAVVANAQLIIDLLPIWLSFWEAVAILVVIYLMMYVLVSLIIGYSNQILRKDVRYKPGANMRANLGPIIARCFMPMLALRYVFEHLVLAGTEEEICMKKTFVDLLTSGALVSTVNGLYEGVHQQNGASLHTFLASIRGFLGPTFNSLSSFLICSSGFHNLNIGKQLIVGIMSSLGNFIGANILTEGILNAIAGLYRQTIEELPLVGNASDSNQSVSGDRS